MMKNIKYAIAAVIVLLAIIGSFILYVYIEKLNNKISDLNNIITAQDEKIISLNKNIESLKLNIEAFSNTLEITNDYINNIEKINYDEDIVKDAILNEVLNEDDQYVKDWFQEAVPDSIINILNDAYSGVCNDGI